MAETGQDKPVVGSYCTIGFARSKSAFRPGSARGRRSHIRTTLCSNKTKCLEVASGSAPVAAGRSRPPRTMIAACGCVTCDARRSLGNSLSILKMVSGFRLHLSRGPPRVPRDQRYGCSSRDPRPLPDREPVVFSPDQPVIRLGVMTMMGRSCSGIASYCEYFAWSSATPVACSGPASTNLAVPRICTQASWRQSSE